MRPPSATPVLRDPTVKVKLDWGENSEVDEALVKVLTTDTLYQYLYIYVTSYIICILNYSASLMFNWYMYMCVE